MSGERALVVGLGLSGVAAARLLRSEGWNVVAVDMNDGPDLRRRAAELTAEGVEVLLGSQGIPPGPAGLCVASPGVPVDSPAVLAAKDAGIPVVGELELAYRRCRCPIVAVTGANGKSTMVKLCGDVLRLAGLRVELGGNYGTPLSAIAPRTGELDWVVVEASSFQLEATERFRPRVGVLMNLQPNHLDRHPTLEAYREAKARMFACVGEGDWAVVHESQFASFKRGAGESARQAQWVRFGTGPRCGFRFGGGHVEYRAGGVRQTVTVAGTYFDNDVLGSTAAAAAAVAAACGVRPELVADAARQFVPLPHRMAPVTTVRGVRFVDDSKATTLAALAAGVTMAAAPVRLIAGGLLKEHRLASVKKVLASHVRAVYVIGKSAPKMERAWGDVVACRRCDTLDVAVEQAWKDAAPGETVLLSPGCASFDQFRGYADRGEQFCRHVSKVAGGVSP
jgi:UDP-N-acetylmuramoylalanine--D-glutamate ligase